ARPHEGGPATPAPRSTLASPDPARLLLDLPYDGCIGNLAVLGEQESLAEDDGEHVIPLEGKEVPVVLGCRRPALGDDAQVLIIGRHEDVAAAQVNLVGAQVAADDEKPIEERATIGDLEARHEAFEDLPAGLAGRG